MPLKENSAAKREKEETNTLKERKLESQPALLWKREMVLETRPGTLYEQR